MLSQSRLNLGRSLARLAGALVDFVHYMLFFGWQRTITLRRWHRFDRRERSHLSRGWKEPGRHAAGI